MPLFKKSLLLLLLLAAGAAAAAAYQLVPAPEAQPLAAGTAPAAKRQIAVHVTGAVQRSGVVMLAEGARAQDAITACGGLLPQADAQAVNLAQVLQDGAQLRVPAVAPQSRAVAAAPAAPAGAEQGKGKTGAKKGPVNINTADLQGLQQLNGIGPALAQRIIDYRQEHGAFRSPEELTKVSGIGKAKFDKMKGQIAI